jgi:hypothetical protein
MEEIWKIFGDKVKAIIPLKSPHPPFSKEGVRRDKFSSFVGEAVVI